MTIFPVWAKDRNRIFMVAACNTELEAAVTAFHFELLTGLECDEGQPIISRGNA